MMIVTMAFPYGKPGMVLSAIKLLRDFTDISLKDAKDLIFQHLPKQGTGLKLLTFSMTAPMYYSVVRALDSTYYRSLGFEITNVYTSEENETTSTPFSRIATSSAQVALEEVMWVSEQLRKGIIDTNQFSSYDFIRMGAHLETVIEQLQDVLGVPK